MSVPQWDEAQWNEARRNEWQRDRPPDALHFRYIIVCGIIGLLCIGLALYVGFVVPGDPEPPDFPDRAHVLTVPDGTR